MLVEKKFQIKDKTLKRRNYGFIEKILQLIKNTYTYKKILENNFKKNIVLGTVCKNININITPVGKISHYLEVLFSIPKAQHYNVVVYYMFLNLLLNVVVSKGHVHVREEATFKNT